MTNIPQNLLDEWERAFRALPTPKSLVPIPTEHFSVEAGRDAGLLKKLRGHSLVMTNLQVTPPTLEALYRVKESLEPAQDIVIYSAYRPPELQFILWKARVSDIIQRNPSMSLEECAEKAAIYTASPSHPGLPPHLRGNAVDVMLTINCKPALTAIDANDYDQMRFDYFANKNPEIHGNRRQLREIMAAGGFTPYHLEYWHFGLTPAIPSSDTGIDKR